MKNLMVCIAISMCALPASRGGAAESPPGPGVPAALTRAQPAAGGAATNRTASVEAPGAQSMRATPRGSQTGAVPKGVVAALPGSPRHASVRQTVAARLPRSNADRLHSLLRDQAHARQASPITHPTSIRAAAGAGAAGSSVAKDASGLRTGSPARLASPEVLHASSIPRTAARIAPLAKVQVPVRGSVIGGPRSTGSGLTGTAATGHGVHGAALDGAQVHRRF